ncbi:MAG: UDP-N-acetylmuramoyl-L-alanyl-D-glutamate--2,6-diaminopimelate ligase [Gammaproteobacteria bacterium]|nr:UDP-N-acetylmuramoyl-L-alanyl-D-glutamate--2,6-diaminopimelate ligase [Gammaproteobacteria bacterium]
MMTAPAEARISLAKLLGIPADRLASNPVITDLTLNSRDVIEGSLFLACAGIQSHGLDYLEQALAQGAVAVAWETSIGTKPPLVDTNVPLLEVPQLRHRLGRMAELFFGAPSKKMEVTGITGTNGKTTCAWLLAGALDAYGQSAGIIGTLGHGFPVALSAGDLTTPDCIGVHRRLAELRGLGAAHVAMEVSSHALDQGRVDGVHFSAALFTNLSHDHLNYHGDLAAYGAAKARLFLNPELDRAVINVDDAYAETIIDQLQHRIRLLRVGRNADSNGRGEFLRLKRVKETTRGLELDFTGSWGELSLCSQLLGDFNASNLALVLAALLADGVAAEDAIQALGQVTAPPGRMEVVAESDRRPLAIVDYSHTPDALEKALNALRRHATGQLWCVFGCGGERDQGKRPLMGEIATRIADQVIVTSDNPRGEDPLAIIADIKAGTANADNVVTIADRREAIAKALEQAGPDDIVLVAGKGHETYQEIAGQKLPFSDTREILQILEET